MSREFPSVDQDPLELFDTLVQRPSFGARFRKHQLTQSMLVGQHCGRLFDRDVLETSLLEDHDARPDPIRDQQLERIELLVAATDTDGVHGGRDIRLIQREMRQVSP